VWGAFVFTPRVSLAIWGRFFLGCVGGDRGEGCGVCP